MDLLDLLKRTEGKTLEFKRDLSSPDGVLRSLVAFANTSGGYDEQPMPGLDSEALDLRHDDGHEERRRCGLCGKILQPYDSISVARVGERCSRCFNEETAKRRGIDFDNTPIAPIVVTDVDGVRHRFEIRSMLVGTGHAMSAREVRKRGARGGSRFEILGDFETDARDLFELLRERIRPGLSVRHIRVGSTR